MSVVIKVEITAQNNSDENDKLVNNRQNNYHNRDDVIIDAIMKIKL